MLFWFLTIRSPPISTPTTTLFPYTPPFRSRPGGPKPSNAREARTLPGRPLIQAAGPCRHIGLCRKISRRYGSIQRGERVMRARIRSIHRWLSLAMMGFWLLQALTGMLLVFQWELDDATVAGPAAPTQIAAIGGRLTALAAAEPGLRIRAPRTSGNGSAA